MPIELAREIVLGSVRYARGLGFDPHPDFAAAAGHLGSWTGPATISFGKDGRPLYVFEPYDNPRYVIRTLKRTVGRGNFEVVAIAGEQLNSACTARSSQTRFSARCRRSARIKAP